MVEPTTKTSIKKVTIDEGKVTRVEFEYKGKRYTAELLPSQIEVKSVGIYKRQEQEFLWQTQHVCGASGFSPMLGDSCPSCDNQGGFVKDYANSRNYAPREIPQAIAHINFECNRLEKILGEKGF